MDLPDSVEIKPSPLHEKGVFATQDIPAHSCLGSFTGMEYSLKDFKEKYGKDIRYCYQLGRLNKIICAKEQRNFITYINESEKPNCYLKRRSCWTARDIKKGEELFLSYNKKGMIKYPRDYELQSHS